MMIQDVLEYLMIKEIQNHFDVYYRKHDSNIAVIKQYFRNY